MQQRQLLRQPRDQRRAFAAELARDDARSLRRAGDEGREKERPADDADILAQQQRLRHREAGSVDGAQHLELGGAVEAEAEPGRGIGAQHQPPAAGESAAVQSEVDAPVLLHRATRQAEERVDRDRARAGGRGEITLERGPVHTLATAWPPSTGSTAPVI